MDSDDENYEHGDYVDLMPDNDEEEKVEIGQEFKAYERTGFQNILLTGDRKTGIITDEERFAEKVNVYLQKYRDELFGDSQIYFLLDKISSIPNVRFKNPLGYVIGYYLVDRDLAGYKYINEIKFNKIKKNRSNRRRRNFFTRCY